MNPCINLPRCVESPGFRRGDAGLLLAPLGLVALLRLPRHPFRRPLACVEAAGAPGWAQRPGPDTWIKVSWFNAMAASPYLSGQHAHLVGNAVATIVVLAFLPLVFRRFGWGYGVYAAAVVIGAAISTKDFVGMGRYDLAAFPCFAVAGDALFARRRMAVAAVAGCASLLVLLAELHARGTLVS